jgi:extradiol dioxygenase family protein
MRNSENVFHLAIPCKDLDETQDFYVNKLGCQLARRYADRVTLNFFGDQVVCHLAPDKIDSVPQMYPRHFGITFKRKEEFNDLLELAREQGLEFFQELTVRFSGKVEQHLTFFLKDPSNNLLEFKFYYDSTMMY